MKQVLFSLFFLATYQIFAQTLTVSSPPGFYDNPFYLKVNSDVGVVRYTFDLKDNTEEFPDSLLINRTCNISLEIISNGSTIKKESFSYFINFETNFKIVSITINDNFLFDKHQGIYVKGEGAYLDTTSGRYLNTNWRKSWEREAFVEIFNASGNRITAQLSGIKIFGGMTKDYPEKSLRIIAREKYGSQDFNADIFDLGITDYKHLVLRHSGNDYKGLRFKDALLTSISKESGLDIQATSPSHLFVNSEYWGVYNIREKLNKYYIGNNYSCSIKGIDILQGNQRLDEGNRTAYKELLAFAIDNDLNDSTNYKYIQTLMDTRNFINFWIHQIYYANIDVRGNIRYWRSDFLDGKFRWIVYDTDLGFRNSYIKRNILSDFTSSKGDKWYNPSWATLLMRELLKSSTFKEDFINQSCILLSSHLSSENLVSRIDEFRELYEEEMYLHFAYRRAFQRNQGSIEGWYEKVNDLKIFAEQRGNYYLNHLEERFNLKDSFLLDISISKSSYGEVMINSNKLDSNFSCKLYRDYNIPISVIPDLGYTYDLLINNDNSINSFSNNIFHNGVEDTLKIKINFIKSSDSNSQIIFNEISNSKNALELYNLGTDSVNISGWTLSACDYLLKLDSQIIPPSCYSSLSLNSIDSIGVFHSPYLYLYDANDQFVDSVTINQINANKNILNRRNLKPNVNLMGDFSLSFPVKSVGDSISSWVMSSTTSIGKENSTYTKYLDKLKKESYHKQKTIILYILSMCVFVFGSIFIVFKG